MENRTQQDNPKIYVACLAAHNDGHLHGEWINANREPHEIHADIQSMLENSPEPAAEEWAVHDYEGFGFITLSEWPDIERVSTIARLIVTHGEPFLLWYQSQDGHNCDCSELEDLFLEQWRGVFDSETDFAYNFLEETGQLSEIPIWAQSYFDYESYARSLNIGGDFSFVRHNCQIYVFSNY